MKRIVAVVSENIGETFKVFGDFQKVVEINFDMRIEDNRLIIEFDDGNNYIDKFVLIDIDDHKKINLDKFVGYNLITIGINNKATITISGIEEELVFCIQREIHTKYFTYEVQEVIIKNQYFRNKTMVDQILMFTVLLIIKGNDIDQIKELLNRTSVEYY